MTQLDRIEDRQIAMDDRLRSIETDLAEIRGARNASVWIGRLASAAIAAIAGGIAGSWHALPGSH